MAKQSDPEIPHHLAPALLTIEEASQLTRWTRSTLYSKVSRREIPYVRLGRSLRFRRRDLLKLFEEVPALGDGRNEGGR